MPLQPGSRIAGFTVEGVVGTGGMGTVYVAQQVQLRRRVALKVLSEELSANDEFQRRFTHEAILVARLSHPNIVAIYDQGRADGHLWIAMQLIDGTDAANALRAAAGHGLDPEQAVEIVEQIAEALDHAHSFGMVHRDVKPANMLLELPDSGGPAERVLLTDFGIAKAADSSGLTKTNGLVATLAYAAPEHLEALQLDGRADQYSLACSAFELLTGHTPFDGDSAAALMFAHLHRTAPAVTSVAPQLPRAVDAVVARAMSKKPSDRFDSCAEFAAQLRSSLFPAQRTMRFDSEPSFPEPISDERLVAQPPPRRASTTRHPILLAVSLALVAVLVGAVLIWKWPGGNDSDQRQPAFAVASDTNAYFQIAADGSPVDRASTMAADPAGSGAATCSDLTLAVDGNQDSPSLAEAVRNGAGLAVDAHNAANPDCVVALRTVDGGSAVATTADPSVIGLIGPTTSAGVDSLGPALDRAGLVFVTPTASQSNLVDRGFTSFFRATADNSVLTQAAARYLERTFESVCVLNADAELSRVRADDVQAVLGTKADPNCSGEIDSLDAVADAIGVAAPAAVYLSAADSTALELRKRSAASVVLVGDDGMYGTDFADSHRETNGQTIATCGCAPAPDDFAAAYRAAHGTQPGLWAVEAYDIATIMLMGIDSGAVDRAALRNYVRTYSGSGIARDYRWLESGELAAPSVWAYRAGK